MEPIKFTDASGSFHMENAGCCEGMYFPVAGECGMKSALTVDLSGDAKLDQNHFLSEPVSVENLHHNRGNRNFWCVLEDGRLWSAVGHSAWQQACRYTDKEESVAMDAGYMWQSVCRKGEEVSLTATITSFVPFQQNQEVHIVTIRNTGSESVTFRPVSAMPLYARSADNIRDHRHVTSLLHRITVHKGGIQVNPTFSFDERGHQLNDTIYFAYGMTEDGSGPEAYEPTVHGFIGERGNLEWPEALLRAGKGVQPGYRIDGQEALGGLYFAKRTLAPGEEASYILFLGVAHSQEEIEIALSEYHSLENALNELDRTKQYWKNKVNITIHTADPVFDQFMNWVDFQPELRRIYGCSFLPHHDYGKGGRGWRDLWQDCLALLLMNPDGVRQMLLGNFGGVRLDGSNATIIGEHVGEFKADRNAIVRMWMDHGVWPYLTTKLYLDQTGDLEILTQQVSYFKDKFVKRAADIDTLWDEKECRQKDAEGVLYRGTVLEHLLLQNLTAFWEVGEHNHLRLRNADWNDALDMAAQRGESVAFSNAYAGNLLGLADLIEELDRRGQHEIVLLQEMEILLKDEEALYEDAGQKRALLDQYMESCRHVVSGKQIAVDGLKLARSLRNKGHFIQEHIRKTEWIKDSRGNGWFNGYYDNQGRALEGERDGRPDMMLTSQVFAVMNGTADLEQTAQIAKSAKEYLYDEGCGGYRLNTDFGEIRTDMGRMFGFAYGEKENGAVFSHMTVMFANALYCRGFAKEGLEALMTLYRQAMNMEISHIYPGIPEYFGRDGRGLYHYLTGAASWYMLTVVTQMFGVQGKLGDLQLSPKLEPEQFDADKKASIRLHFRDRRLQVVYENPKGLSAKDYKAGRVYLDQELLHPGQGEVRIEAARIDSLEAGELHVIHVILE